MTRTTHVVAAAIALIQGSSANIAMVEVPVGSPAEKHSLLFDTGSGSTWIVDKKCAKGACKNTSGFPWIGYDSNASSTSIDLGVYDSTTFLGGKIGGPAMIDVFEVDGTSWNQSFIAANETSWQNIPGDGFFAMAFSSIAEPSTNTAVETMMWDGILDKPKFSIYYGREEETSSEHSGGGAITIGASEEEKYVDGAMTWLPVKKGRNGQDYELWSAKLRAFTGSSKGSDSTQPSSGSFKWEANKAMGVFDTGAGTVGVPDDRVDDMYHAIGWPGMQALMNRTFVPLCSYFNSTWSVTFSFTGDDDDTTYHNLTIRGDQLRGSTGFGGRKDACWPPFEGSGSNGLALIGSQFLSNVYSVYDFGSTNTASYKPTMGFGSLKQEYAPLHQQKS